MGRVVGSLSVVTCKDGDAESAMLASWISQASFDPPGLTVAVKRDRATESLMVCFTDAVYWPLVWLQDQCVQVHGMPDRLCTAVCTYVISSPSCLITEYESRAYRSCIGDDVCRSMATTSTSTF